MIFEIAKELNADPVAVTKWPALMLERAKFYVAVMRQREADDAENREARRDAGLS